MTEQDKSLIIQVLRDYKEWYETNDHNEEEYNHGLCSMKSLKWKEHEEVKSFKDWLLSVAPKKRYSFKGDPMDISIGADPFNISYFFQNNKERYFFCLKQLQTLQP